MPIVEIATAVAGSKLVEACWAGAVGNYFHQGCEWLRSGDLTGTPENHDVLKAMHRCFVESLKLTSKACAGVDGANRASRDGRLKLAEYAKSKWLATLEFDKSKIPDTVLERQIREIYGQQKAEARVNTTDLVIAFTERQIGIELTPPLRRVFHEGNGQFSGWAPTFELLFSSEVKSNEKVRSILLFARANELVSLAKENEQKIEALFDQLESIEAAIRDGFEATGARLDEIRADIAALAASVEQSSPQQAAPFAEALTQLAESPEAADRAIADEVLSGDYAEAFSTLIGLAEAEKKNNAERYRQAARLIAPFQPSKALEAYRQAADLDPAHLWTWIELGRLRVDYATLNDARTSFQTAHQYVSTERDRMVLHVEFGNILMREGKLSDARIELSAALDIAERLVSEEPGNPQWLRDLSVNLGKVGDVEFALGNLSAARKRFEMDFAIAGRLAAMHPSNAEWQRDLAVSHSKLGDVEVAAGNLAAAGEQFEASLAITKQLAADAPDNTQRENDLSLLYDRIGELEFAVGKLDAARDRFEAGLEIRKKLAVAEPRNAQWQRDLSVSYSKLGELEIAAENIDAALVCFEEDLRITEWLVLIEPNNAQWQRDLSVTFEKLGDIEFAIGDLEAARERFAASLNIRERLGGAEPSNARSQRDLSVSLGKLGDVEVASGNFGLARKLFKSGLAIRNRLAAAEPENVQLQRDL